MHTLQVATEGRIAASRQDGQPDLGVSDDLALTGGVCRARRMIERVARSYVDALGQERHAAPEEVRFEALIAEEAHRFVAPTRVLREGEPIALDVTLPAMSWPESVKWSLTREDGSIEEGTLPLRDAAVVRADHRPESSGQSAARQAAFLVTLGLDTRENGHRVRSRQWHLEFPRNGT